MSVSLAPACSPAPAAPFFSFAEPASSPRSRSLRSVEPVPAAPPPTSTPASALCEAPAAEEFLPAFSVDVLTLGAADVLVLSIPAQPLPERGYIQAHRVHGTLRSPLLELELYSVSPRRPRPRLISVGVWAFGDYVKWRGERRLDFALLDVVDACLRLVLPPGGGRVSFLDPGAFASAAGVSFRA